MRRDRRRGFALLAFGVCGCATLRIGRPFDRPSILAGEWIDPSQTTATDTALWVLRSDGYDGFAHVLVEHDAFGNPSVRRTQTRYGSWYFDGNLADSTHRAICFARRIGRDGATCLTFSIDTNATSRGLPRRLLVHGYPGEDRTGTRELIARRPESPRP
jgi:hypothetical protein